VFVTVEFVQSENKPLSLEQGARWDPPRNILPRRAASLCHPV